MKKRVFISIPLPEGVQNKLVKCQEDITKSFTDFNDFCPIKWTKKHNLHVTLFFVGNIDLDQLVDVFEKTEKVLSNYGTFWVDFKSVSYGPEGKSPKMVWANGEASPELGQLQAELEKELFSVREPDNRFTPHITLGRIVQWKFNRINPEERPDATRDVSFSFPIDSIDIMESELGKGGAQYTVLRSIPLTK